jgi:hypothetical protein
MRCDALIPVRLKPLRFFQDCSFVSPQPSAQNRCSRTSLIAGGKT